MELKMLSIPSMLQRKIKIMADFKHVQLKHF